MPRLSCLYSGRLTYISPFFKSDFAGVCDEKQLRCTFEIDICDASGTVCKMLPTTDADSFDYPAPIIVPRSLRLYDSQRASNTTGILQLDETYPQLVVFTVL